MTSTPPDVAQSTPGTKETLLSALHSAMQTNVKVNQDPLSSPASSPIKETPDSQVKKVPPTAPPPVVDPVAVRRQTRAQSMIVPSASRPSDFGFNVPGQKDGQLVTFNPREEFQKLVSTTATSFPRSSLQLEESSTILHPSQFKQIVAFDTTSLGGMDPRYRRRHTISGTVGASRKVPSQYREVLFQKSQFGIHTPPTAPSSSKPAAAPTQPLQSTPAQPADSQLTALMQSTEGPKPTAPKRRRPQPPVADEEETESEEEEENGDETPDKQGSTTDGSKHDEALHVYGLEYDGGLIDFVEHPTTAAAPDTKQSPAQPAASSPPSDDVQAMERVMSPELSS